MKENFFKTTESMSDILKTMDDKTAGKFAKAVCDYAFGGVVYGGNEPVVKSNFILVKRILDGQKRDVYHGKLGAMKAKEQREKKSGEKFGLKEIVIGSVLDGLLTAEKSGKGGSENT